MCTEQFRSEQMSKQVEQLCVVNTYFIEPSQNLLIIYLLLDRYKYLLLPDYFLKNYSLFEIELNIT